MRETMKYNSTVGILFFITILAISALSYSSSPRENTIPIISMKTGIDATSQDINMNVICNLLWHNFDGIWISGWLEGDQHTPVLLCDSAGAYVVLSPSRLQTISYDFPTLWARYTIKDLQEDNAYIHTDQYYDDIIDSTYAVLMSDSINVICKTLADSVANYSNIWYFDIMNEGSAHQLAHMLSDTSQFDDYFPSLLRRISC